ncbi:MAG TPA: hypothetical protein PLW81_13060 [Thiobacillaceae bacterium]|nr:hypothetical protein [Thiobacillaceae bacterium]
MRPGLSLEQAPPFTVPLRFYLAAPFFLAAAGLLAAWPDGAWNLDWSWDRPWGWTWGWTSSRWSPRAIALTHLLALGFLGLVMLGSLAQMLPVVAGVPLPASLAVSRLSHAGLLAGIPLLAGGMLTLAPWALLAGAGLASLGLALFAGAAALALLHARPSPTVWAMRVALLGLLILWPLGAWLAAWLAGLAPARDPIALTGAHALAGLVLWVGLLVVGVSYQVVPMLQVTPNYPPRLARWLAWGVFALALPLAAGGLAGWPAAWLETGLTVGLAAALATYALATLDLQRRRRRKLGDATLDYWRLAMASLLLACGFAVGRQAWPEALGDAWEVFIGLLFLLGFAVGVVNGMLFKIVPFLAWFHLNTQVGMRGTGLTSMKDFIADADARRQFRLHLGALGLLLPSPWLQGLALPGGLALAVSAGMLGWLLWRARRVFVAAGGREGG